MATVYRALDTRLDRTVALKVMHPELAVDGEFVDRFIREARAAAKLSHPAVVGVFDQGEDDGMVFLSMEYVEGRTLRQILRESGRLAPAQALETIEPVLAALTAAHEAGIVHCDVKPENVLVGENGRVKVADFGLAKALTDPAATSGPLLGTVNYISPEQALGEPATPRSDVYAAGIVLYELLTGEPPHAHPHDDVVVRNHIDNDVPAPSSIDPSIPPLVDELVRRSTARDPHARFASASALADGVEQVRGTLGGTTPGLDSRESAGVSVDEALTRVAANSDDRAHHTTHLPVAGAALAPATPRRARRANQSQSHGSGTAVARRAGSVIARRTDASPVRRAGTAVARRAQSGRQRRAARPRARWRRIVAVSALVTLIAGVIVGAWWLGEGRYVTAPSLLNMTVEEATVAADEAGVRVRAGGTEPSETFEAGRVMRTEPGPNERLLRGVPIILITSSGPDRVTVPDVRGLSLEDATAELEEAGLVVEGPEESYHGKVDEGKIISQGTSGGDEVKPGTPVLLTVSLGRERLDITNYTGLDANQAEQALTELGFEVVREEQPHPNVQEGFVISQQPQGGTGYSGDTITLVVATPPATIQVPNVVGQTAEAAEQILSEAGFTNIKIDQRPSLFPRGIVTEQRPPAGREVRSDREIVLRVR
jgi:beta-lactam-binding protein with PASTA domain